MQEPQPQSQAAAEPDLSDSGRILNKKISFVVNRLSRSHLCRLSNYGSAWAFRIVSVGPTSQGAGDLCTAIAWAVWLQWCLWSIAFGSQAGQDIWEELLDLQSQAV